MSIRLRLTVLYSAILALTLIVFSAVLYAAQSQYTLNIVRGDLSKNARQVAMGLVRAQYDLYRREPGPEPPPWGAPDGDGVPQMMQPIMRETRVRDIARLLDVDGTALDLAINEQSEELPLSEEGLHQLQSGQPWTEFAWVEDERLLVYNEPVKFEDEVIGIVQIARSLADRDRSLNSLGLTLIMGSLATTLIAFGVGWTLSGVTLRPIQKITQTAREIGQARDFSSRVAHTGPNDELGRLATTFNEMLAHLEDGYQQVAHALQVQRDFVADVSHELRTPLTTIHGNLALLRRDPPLPSEEQADILNDLLSESERLGRLVSDLLMLARTDAGRKLLSAPVPVKDIADDICRQARLLAPDREITCHMSEDALVALANEDALKQVLLILLDNAIKHTEGPIDVSVGQNEAHVTIRVRDSGPGVQPELQARLFDRFYRGDASRSTPGFGLGLSIARALTEAQQGNITVESHVGEGSTFVVTLPKAEEI